MSIDNNSKKFRGDVLHNMSLLEYAINLYIAKYFCNNDKKKLDDMQLLILGDERMSFRSKLDVFIYLTKTYAEEWYKSYKDVKSDLNKDLK